MAYTGIDSLNYPKSGVTSLVHALDQVAFVKRNNYTLREVLDYEAIAKHKAARLYSRVIRLAYAELGR